MKITFLASFWKNKMAVILLEWEFAGNVTVCHLFYVIKRGHGGRVVTLAPPTFEAGIRSPARPQVGKLVVACRWSAVYSTEP